MAELRRFLNERDPAGGRPKALLFLCHPGPSLLVSAVTVAAATLLRGGVHESMMLSLALIMLPMQVAIGALNDWADLDSDRLHKPFKPLARGSVGRGTALAVAILGFAVSLATAVHWSVTFLLIALLGVASGAVYDLGLKRTPLSFICYWGGLQCVVLLVTTAAEVDGGLLTLPLAGLLALALHVANAIPDSEGDRLAGATTVPVALGTVAAGWCAAAALATATLYAAACVATGRVAVAGLASSCLLALAAGLSPPAAAARFGRAGFAVLALLAGVAAIGWLGALPHLEG